MGELDEEFGYYGRIVSVWVARSPPGFAYIIFEDSQDARDAVRGLDGKMICGHRVKVDLSNNVSRSRPRPPPPRPYFGGGDRFGGGRFGGRFGGGAPHSQKRCYTCDRMGHISRDCPKFRRNFRSRSRSRRRSRSIKRSRSRRRRRSRSSSGSSSSSNSSSSRSRSRSKSKTPDEKKDNKEERNSVE